LNEPWVGDFFSKPEQLLARNADALNLAPMFVIIISSAMHTLPVVPIA
jgi:hypothetical protein